MQEILYTVPIRNHNSILYIEKCNLLYNLSGMTEIKKWMALIYDDLDGGPFS